MCVCGTASVAACRIRGAAVVYHERRVVVSCAVLCCVCVGGSGSGEEGPSGGSERSELFTTALWTLAPVHNMLPAHWTGVGVAEPGLQAGLVEVVLTSDLQGITVG